MDTSQPGWNYFFDNSDPVGCEITSMDLHVRSSSGCGSLRSGSYLPVISAKPDFYITVR